jgi:hypothetical protein
LNLKSAIALQNAQAFHQIIDSADEILFESLLVESLNAVRSIRMNLTHTPRNRLNQFRLGEH